MKFVKIDKKGNSSSTRVQFGSCANGGGFHELHLTNEDIAEIRNFHGMPGRLGTYILDKVCTRHMGIPVIQCPPLQTAFQRFSFKIWRKLERFCHDKTRS